MDKEEAKKRINPGCSWMADVGDRCFLEMLIINDEAAIAKVRAYKASLDVFISEKDAEIDACKNQEEIDAVLGTFKRPRLVL